MPYDIIAILIVLIASFVSVVYLGKSSSISVIFSLFVATLLSSLNPYKELILSYGRTQIEISVISILVFILVFLICYIIIRKSISVVFPWTPISKAFEISVLSILISGLSIAVITDILGLEKYMTNQIVVLMFQNANSLFYWLALSIIALTLVSKR